MSRASAGIWGRDSLRGPPQAEQDMEVGVFCRVHLRQSHDTLPPSVDGAWAGRRGPRQLLERRGRGQGRSSDESRVRVEPQREQDRLSAGLDRVQRGQDQPDPRGSQRGSERRRGASQMEQRGAPAAFRNVQQPQAHWVRGNGTEPDEKLEAEPDTK